MTQIELIKGLKYLGICYSKEYTQEECEIYYSFLKDYSENTFVQAVKQYVKENKFAPTINQLITECEKRKNEFKFEILEKMKADNYFKNEREYEKATMFLIKNIIPDWFKKDLQKYQQILITGNQQKLLEEFK